jgi:L-2-hydroxyglutarate oxidase LhgO
VDDLRLVSRDEARAIEPEVECQEALFSPSTGIIDSHALMLALQGDAEAHGAVVACATAVQGYRYEKTAKAFVVQATSTGSEDSKDVQEVECDYFVNASGLFAPHLVKEEMAAVAMGQPEVPAKLAKGTYFKLSSRRPFRFAFVVSALVGNSNNTHWLLRSHLVYPIPEVGGLGIHSTVDLQGNVRFGPDVEWVDSVNYVVWLRTVSFHDQAN